MKIVAVIPARYGSSRFPGKPLADLFGKPMIWWVYNRISEISAFNEVIVATDDSKIKEVCDNYGMKCLITSSDHATHVNRIHEVSEKVPADYYVVVCGDEPLIKANVVEAVIPNHTTEEMYVGGLCRVMTDPAEVIDPANIKIVTNDDEECILLSRAAVPFPYKTILFKYKKVVGVECYNKKALDFFVATPKGPLETIEDVTLQRFLENKIHIKYKMVNSVSLSVDTPRDLEKVRSIMSEERKL